MLVGTEQSSSQYLFRQLCVDLTIKSMQYVLNRSKNLYALSTNLISYKGKKFVNIYWSLFFSGMLVQALWKLIWGPIRVKGPIDVMNVTSHSLKPQIWPLIAELTVAKNHFIATFAIEDFPNPRPSLRIWGLTMEKDRTSKFFCVKPYFNHWWQFLVHFTKF